MILSMIVRMFKDFFRISVEFCIKFCSIFNKQKDLNSKVLMNESMNKQIIVYEHDKPMK